MIVVDNKLLVDYLIVEIRHNVLAAENLTQSSLSGTQN